MAEYIKVYYKKFWEHAKVPDRATPFSAGSDLYSAFEYCIPREGQTAIDTGIGAVIPPTHQGHIYSKSKLAYERSLHVGAGVVDILIILGLYLWCYVTLPKRMNLLNKEKW